MGTIFKDEHEMQKLFPKLPALKMMDILQGKICPYCEGPTRFIDSSIIYGKSYGMIYLCKPCDAYVGVHRGTNKALGRLADAQLRYWKKRVHKAFDHLWKSGKMKRYAAYAWLSEKLQIPPEYTHIGMMDVDGCQRVIEVCRKEIK